LPFIAIGAFAGARTEEILRLDWEDIHWDQNFVILGRNKTKTATRRIVPILPALAAWLAPYRGKTGKICIYARTQRCAQRLGVPFKTPGTPPAKTSSPKGKAGRPIEGAPGLFSVLGGRLYRTGRNAPQLKNQKTMKISSVAFGF
jgi:integrase